MPDPHPLVCRFGAFGDMVLITPLLKQLYQRSGLPCDVIGIGGWNRSLFENMPYVRQVFTIDSRSAPYWFNRSQRQLVKSLRQHQHQFTWVCETSSKSYRLLTRAGIRRDNSANQLDLAPVENEHYCAKWIRLGNQSPPGFDFPSQNPEKLDTELFVTAAEVQDCRQWMQARGIDQDRPIVCIQAGSKRTTRRGRVDRESNTKYWHEHNWATTIDQLIEKQPDAQILLCGVPAELGMCHAIEAACQHPAQVQSVADDLPLRRLLALLSISHSCISVDTGPAHAAAALNCPLVVLFGKASPERFRPVSARSPVEIIVGRASNNALTDPDISHITAQQVLLAWLKLA